MNARAIAIISAIIVVGAFELLLAQFERTVAGIISWTNRENN